MARARKQASSTLPTWTFFSNHAHVLLSIARDPEIRLRDLADQVGISERAVQRIIAELQKGNYIERARFGRRNRYRICPDVPLRHRFESNRTVRALVALIVDS